MDNRIFEDIERTILEAMHKTEAAINKAEIHEACCEAETDDTQAMVMEAEAGWTLNNTEEAGIALDRAYDLHDKAMREYYDAVEDRKALHAIYELLEQATWNC